MSMLTAEELAIANSFAEHYLDITDSLPNDIQRNISSILETDIKMNGIMENLMQERIKYESASDYNENSETSLNRLEQCFLHLQEINDSKLGYTSSILELIDENLKVLENDKKLIEKNENLRQLFIMGLPEANQSKSTIIPQISSSYNHPPPTPSWNFGKVGKKTSATSPYHHDYDFELTPYHRNSPPPPYFTTPQRPPPYEGTSPSYGPAISSPPGGEGTPNASPPDDEESRVNAKGAVSSMNSPPSRSKRHRRAKGVTPAGDHYVYGGRTSGKNKMATASAFGTGLEDGSGRRSGAKNAISNLSSVGLGKRRRRKRKTFTTDGGSNNSFKTTIQNRLASTPSAHSSSAIEPVNHHTAASPHHPSSDEDDDPDDVTTTTLSGQASTGGALAGGVGTGAGEPRYCLCDRVSFGEMIACDNERCPLEWFHFACVGLTGGKPKGRWYCPRCRRDPLGKSCKYPAPR